MSLTTVEEVLQMFGTAPTMTVAQVSKPPPPPNNVVDVVEEGETLSRKAKTPSSTLGGTSTAGSAADGAYQKNGSVTSRPDLVEDSLSSPPKRPTISAEEVTPTSDAAGNPKLFLALNTVGTTKPNTPSGQALPIPPTPLLPLAPRDLNAGTTTQRNIPLDNDDVHKTAAAAAAARRKIGGRFLRTPEPLKKSLLPEAEQQNHNLDNTKKGHGNEERRGRQQHQNHRQGTKDTHIQTNSAKKPKSSSLPVPSPSPKQNKTTTTNTTAGQSKSVPGIEKTLRALDKAERRHRDNHRREVAIWASEVARMGTTETDSILADKQQQETESKNKKNGNRQLKLKQQFSSSSGPSATTAEKPRGPVLGKLSFLGWARKASSSSLRSPITSTTNTPTSLSSSSSTTGTSPVPADLDPKNKNTDSSAPPSQSMSRNFITPQVDAPKGASNGTDRRVTVRCRGTKADLDVKNETSTVDILVAFCEHDPITVNASLLVESYVTLGLQRRLRRYERIWNVMNSWDGDSSNSLIIWPDSLKTIDKDLDLANVTHREPPGFVLSLYHSHRPGKWNKRYIILQEGGQVISSKHADPGPSDKDVVNLCHLSDYDIYTPTETQMKAQKFPRKYCYAIKSQEKKNIFVNSDNYVHYFCTSDPSIAERFHACIHAWRSWYMVHKMLELHKKKKAREAEKPPQIPLVDPSEYQPKKGVGHVQINGHKVKVSVDESPYTIGAFAPLIDTRRFNKPLEEFGEDWEADERRKSLASHHGRTHSLGEGLKPKKLVGDLNPTDTFAANGLLGNAYAQRKQAKLEEERQRQTSQGSTGSSFAAEGQPTLLNGGLTTGSHEITLPSPEKKAPEKSSWFPSALEHTAKQRSEQQRRPSRPSISSGTSSHHEYQERRGPPSSGGLQRRGTTSNRQHSHPHPPPGQPQPLVTFTPTFVEAPQWSRDGRGRGVKPPEGTPLVDFATGPTVHPHSRFTPAAPPQNLIRRGTQREAGNRNGQSQSQHRPPPLQRRATESNESRPPLPLVSPTGSTYPSASLPTRRPTVTSTTSRSRRTAGDVYNNPSPVSPTSPTAMEAGGNGIPLPRNFAMRTSNNDREMERERPDTSGSSPGGGVYGYAPGPGPGPGNNNSGGPSQMRARGYSRSASGQPQQQMPAQQLGQIPPRYLSSRGGGAGEPRSIPPPAATGGARDPRELLLLQKQQRELERDRDMERGRQRERAQAPQPLGQRAPLRTGTIDDGYGRP